MASSIIGRKVFPVAAAALTANLTSSSGGISSILDGKSDGGWINSSRAICEAVGFDYTTRKSDVRANDNIFLFKDSGVRETVLRKRVSSA
jgi:hypothetical protein